MLIISFIYQTPYHTHTLLTEVAGPNMYRIILFPLALILNSVVAGPATHPLKPIEKRSQAVYQHLCAVAEQHISPQCGPLHLWLVSGPHIALDDSQVRAEAKVFVLHS